MAEAEQTNQDSGGAEGKKVALTPMQKNAQMIAAYAKRLVGDERAQMFVATLSLMMQKDPKLAMCTPNSVLAAMMSCVHLDLMPNTPEGYAYIIPYKNHKTGQMEAQFQVGYKGLVQLAWRSNGIDGISAEMVFPEDQFEVDFATRRISHKPDLSIDRTDWSKAVAVYGVAVLKTGALVFDVMSRSEVDKVKKTVKAKSTGTPWQDWEEAMVKKTPIKRLTKMLPSSTNDKLALATQYDSWAQAGKLAFKNGQLVEDKVEIVEKTAEEQAALKAEAAQIAADLKAQDAAASEPQQHPDEDTPNEN